MPPLENQEFTLRNDTKMLKESFRTAHTDVNDKKEDTRARAKILNREDGEDGNDEII